MNCEILAVGTELLLGTTVNTNAAYIGTRLSALGINLYRSSVVGDNRERIVAAIGEALSRADILITTGGLGPTVDDITKESIAEHFGIPMILDQSSADALASFFRGIGSEMTQNNLRQAEFPEGSEIFPNRHGTAPGCAVARDGKYVIVLPGPPREMKGMFEDFAAAYLSRFSSGIIVSRSLKMVGIGESNMEDAVRDIIDAQQQVTIAPYAKEGECELRISAKASRSDEAEALIVPVEQQIRDRLGSYIYGSDDAVLEKAIIDLLAKSSLTISFAESCTGGMVASRFTAIPGSSKVVVGGIVAYSNDVKINMLNVDPRIIESHGAVSVECAGAMAMGVARALNTDVAIAVTGIAGPDGGTEAKPVGTVCFGLFFKGELITQQRQFTRDRAMVRLRSSVYAADMVRRKLIGTL